jgi:hypothetical protein
MISGQTLRVCPEGKPVPTFPDHALARLVNPGFLGEPFVIGLADWAVGAREEHRTASKPLPIRFDARRDLASRLRAFDHNYAQLDPPRFAFVSEQRVRSPSAGLHLFSREALVPADRGGLQKFNSGGFLQDPGEALLDRLGRLGRDFPSELPKFPVLRGRDFEVLAALCG